MTPLESKQSPHAGTSPGYSEHLWTASDWTESRCAFIRAYFGKKLKKPNYTGPSPEVDLNPDSDHAVQVD